MRTYTREQIDRGEGLLPSGEWTFFYEARSGGDRYIARRATDTPESPQRLAAGGRLLAGGRPSVTWLRLVTLEARE